MSAAPPRYENAQGYPPQQGYQLQQGYPPQQGYQLQQGYPPQQGYPITIKKVVQFVPQPPNYFIMSVVVLLCCNCLFGGIALIFSLMSDCAYKKGRIDEARSKGQTAKYINIVGIVIAVILIIIYFFRSWLSIFV